MSKVLDVLKKTRAVIEKPEAWTKGVCHGVRTEGGVLETGVSGADCHCLIGALAVATEHEPSHLWLEAKTALAWQLPRGVAERLVEFNDHPRTTHADVLALLDKTIAEWEGTV